MMSCPSCTSPITSADSFCEACGATLRQGATPAPGQADEMPAATGVSGQPCHLCGAFSFSDGFCDSCGTKQRSARDHWHEQPVPWVAGVCDRGIAHARNEDAMALAATADGSMATLVVCDGVTTAPDSDRASLAACRAACAVLAAQPPPAGTAPAQIVHHDTAAMMRAAEAANGAVVAIARTLGDPPEPPSCTFVAAVVRGAVATVGWCGDSRAYWIPDAGDPIVVSVDHSLGTELVGQGMSRQAAEQNPSFHTITRWLGADSANPTPETASVALDGPGWLLVCSDGLWNYASSAEAMAAELARCAKTADHVALETSRLLVEWANECGGHDNITVALVRHPAGDEPPSASVSSSVDTVQQGE